MRLCHAASSINMRVASCLFVDDIVVIPVDELIFVGLMNMTMANVTQLFDTTSLEARSLPVCTNRCHTCNGQSCVP